MKLLPATRLAYTLKGEPVPNEDPVTGCHFGVISSNDDTLNMDAVQEIFDKGTDLDTEEIVDDKIEEIVKTIMAWAVNGYPKDAIQELFEASPHVDELILADLHAQNKVKLPWTAAEVRRLLVDENRFDRDAFLDECGNDFDLGDSSLLYEEEGYKILKAADGDLFVEKSPFYALRGYCSPCAPNAAHLLCAGDVPCYALGPEFFEDGKMPYECKPVNKELKSPAARLTKRMNHE
jgi:hypothetical protein